MKKPATYIRKFLSWRPGRLAKGTLAMTLGMGLRTVAQVGVFLIIARVLGVAGYGAYVAVVALAGALGSFGSMGTQTILVRDVARNPDRFASAWGRTLGAIAVSSPFLLAVYLLLAWAVLPIGISSAVTICIGLAELVFTPYGVAAIYAYQSLERIGRASQLVLALILPKLIAAFALVPLAAILPDDRRLIAWATLYTLAALIGSIYAKWRVSRDLGPALKPRWPDLFAGMSEGVPFAIGNAAIKLYTDIDKTMLARLVTLEVTGAYSAGYRVVDMATIPLNATLVAAAPRFFRAGEAGSHQSTIYAMRVLPLPLAYALVVGIILHSMANLLQVGLGADYLHSVRILQWLAWLPLVATPRIFLQRVLGTSGHQMLAVTIITTGALFNILTNLWLIPSWGWRGAVFATYAAELSMTVAMIVGLTLYCSED